MSTAYTSLLKLKLLFSPRPGKLLFEHIPKCGGTTVVNYLRSQYLDNRIFTVYGKDTGKRISLFKSLSQEKRYNYDLIVSHGAHQLRHYCHPDTLKATILRDPVERIISHYYYVLRTPAHYLHKKVTENNMSLADYVTSDLCGELRNSYVARFLEIPADEVDKNADKCVARAQKIIKEEYSVTGILDRLHETMESLARSRNFHSKFKSRKLNVTTDRPTQQGIEKNVLCAIETTNALDVRLYQSIAENITRN